MTEVVCRSPVSSDCNNQALQAAMELSMMNMSNCSPQGCVEPYYCLFDGYEGISKSLNVTQCVSVPSSEHVAEIVGKQGCKIKALRAKTNTYIKTPVRGEEPIFSISGRPDHVNSAKWEIIAAAEHFSQIRASRHSAIASPMVPGSDKVTIYVRVPYRVVGLVVGPRGATVKRIQQVTRTFIVTPSRDKEPCFEVRGTPENVERAKKEIESYIVLRTGNKCASDLGGGVYSSNQSTDLLAQQMQQCHLVESQYESDMSSGQAAIQWSQPVPTVFSGMGFIPPDVSYQPMSAPLLAAEKVFDFSTVGGKPQPLSPTGSYESNSSDGFSTVSPKQSPHVNQRVVRVCCMCKSDEEMAALFPCGHSVFCQTCAHYISCSTGCCPLCNAQVTNVMHI